MIERSTSTTSTFFADPSRSRNQQRLPAMILVPAGITALSQAFFVLSAFTHRRKSTLSEGMPRRYKPGGFDSAGRYSTGATLFFILQL